MKSRVWPPSTLRPGFLLGAGVAAVVAIAWAWGRIDVAELHASAARLDGPAVFGALTLLPLAGFPVSVLHVVAGVRFGTATGLALVALSILLQLLASYALVRLAPAFFMRQVDPLRRRLPPGTHRSVTVFTLLLPGAPYFAQNYVLPLIGVPLGTYLAWGFPIHVTRSIAGVVFGDLSDDLTPARLAGFGLYFLTVTLLCAWAFRTLRSQLRAPPPAGDDRRRRASARCAARKRPAG